MSEFKYKDYVQIKGGSQEGEVFKQPAVKCDICKKENLDTFIDGATFHGPWANMCYDCHDMYGTGFGRGKGQLYKVED